MNFEQAKNYLLSHDWYYQSLAAKPLYISYPMRACYSMKLLGKQIPVAYDVKAYIGKDDVMDDYLTKESLSEVALYYWKRQQKDSTFIFKLAASFDALGSNGIESPGIHLSPTIRWKLFQSTSFNGLASGNSLGFLS